MEFKQLKNIKLKLVTLFLLPLIMAGFMGGVIGAYLVKYTDTTEQQKIKEFYETEMATVVSPTTVKKWVDQKSDAYILVDLRSAAEYEKEHFMTAVNIPAVSMDEEQLVNAFKQLDQSKEIIVHCYSAYCTLGRQVGKTLAKHGVYVKELTIGWSELRYHYDLWNPGAKPEDGEKYIIKGNSEQGEEVIAPCVEGQFGC